MRLVLFEDAAVAHLRPLVDTRAAADLRVGIRTLGERQRALFPGVPWALHTRRRVAVVVAEAHPGVAVNPPLVAGGVWLVNQRLLDVSADVRRTFAAAAQPGEPARAFVQGDTLVAAWLPQPPADLLAADAVALDALGPHRTEPLDGAVCIDRLWHLLDDIGGRVAADFAALGHTGQAGATVQPGAVVVGTDLYLAPGAVVRPGAIVNALDGPVYLGAGAVVEEGAVVRGPVYLGDGAHVKMAGRLDQSAIGPGSKVGGEVHACLFQALSNKGHDGYLGNTFVGQWCNFGADSNASNLRNDYGPIALYDAVAQDFVPTGRQFLGLVMGDHSKVGINSMFNTGTVVGVSCNLFGAGFLPRHVPSFSWGGPDGLDVYRLDKAVAVAEAVLARRQRTLSPADRALLAALWADQWNGA